MTDNDAFNTIATVLGALGGGGAVVLGMSTWLGKLWADRFLATEKAKWELQLAHYRTASEQCIAELKADVELRAKNSHLKFAKLHEERLGILADCYSLLSDVYLNATRCVEPDLFGRDKSSVKELLRSALVSYDELKKFFERHKLYFPVAVETTLQHFIYVSAQSLDEYRVYADAVESDGWSSERYNRLALKWHSSLLADLNTGRDAVSSAFRSMIEE